MQQRPAADALKPSAGRYIYMHIKHGEKNSAEMLLRKQFNSAYIYKKRTI